MPAQIKRFQPAIVSRVKILSGLNIATRAAETVVAIPHGQTVIIGGPMETQKIETVRRVPLLGDIPLLEVLFRRTIREDVKKELVLFLIPYIVTRPDELGGITRQELEQTPMAIGLIKRPTSVRFTDDIPLPTTFSEETP